MKTIDYTITLKSDAEPTTGLGGDSFDSCVPRDLAGRPFFPASHIKGLTREELARIEGTVSFGDIVERALGRPDDDGACDEKNEALVRFSDAIYCGETPLQTEYTTRTAIDPRRGRAKSGALRTFERLPVEARFRGRVTLSGSGDSQEELATLAALLAVGSLGSSRSRGVGRVLIEFDDKELARRAPGDLLLDALNAKPFERAAVACKKAPTSTPTSATKALRIVFRADSPVCCPTTPTIGNTIESGFTISASAVRGWLVSRLARRFGDEFAQTLYRSEQFRAWPLTPCASSWDGRSFEALPTSTRVSLSHKVAKMAVDGQALRVDEAEDKPLREVERGALESANPLKAQDGVLLAYPDGKIALWKGRSMPRVLAQHSSRNDPKTPDRTNLFTTLSCAPLVWAGVVVAPEEWIDAIRRELGDKTRAAFGAFRSIMGQGDAFIAEQTDASAPWALGDNANVLIVQSPVLAPDEYLRKVKETSANALLEELVKDSWSNLFADGKLTVEAVSTTFSVAFGWNRNSLVKGRQEAKLVANPGSIFQFRLSGRSGAVDAEERREVCALLRERGLDRSIRSGLGGGVERGFGAVSTHPGVASALYRDPDLKPRTLRSEPKRNALFQECLTLWRKNRRALPSSSQVAAVAGIAARDRSKAKDYLDDQMKRLKKIWDVWNGIKKDVDRWLTDGERYDADDVQFAFKTLGDLIKAYE